MNMAGRLGDARGLPQTPGRLSRIEWLSWRCPTTLLAFGPLVLFVIPMGIMFQNPRILSLMGLCVLVGVGTLAADLLVGPPVGVELVADVRSSCGSAGLWPTAKFVFVVAALSKLTYASTGYGTVANQVSGSVSRGFVSNVAALFASWTTVAVALVICSYASGVIDRRRALVWVLMMSGVELLSAIASQKLMGFALFVLPLLVPLSMFGLIRLRHIVASIALGGLVLPALFAFRNASRFASGVRVNSTVTLEDRLRLDRQIGLVMGLKVPAHVGEPGILQLVRFGVIPRILDPGRPTLSTGLVINKAMGGSSSSAFSFLAAGDAYFFYGALGVLVAFAGLGAVLHAFLRAAPRKGTPAMVGAVLTMALPLNWLGTFPDVIAGYLQALEASVPVVMLLALNDRLFGRALGASTVGK